MDQKYIDRFHTRYKVMPNGCWEWTGSTNWGYGVMRISSGNTSAHRFSYLIHKSDPGNLNVCHTCDNPACVNPDHLWLGTHRDNMNDMFQKGRSTRGEKGFNAKLTEADVLAIRASTEDYITLSKRYNISRNYVYQILNRKNWKHI